MLSEQIAYDPMAAADEAAAANKRFLDALATGIGPTKLLWSGVSGGYSQKGWRLADLSNARAVEIEASRVDRDACTFCGVRADHGCKHNRH